MHLRHFGPYVVGENLAQQQHEHRLIGRFRNDSYYTGTWENIAEGELWHGAFQFVLSPDGSRMFGWWLGFDSEGVVRSGPWAWRRVSTKADRKTKEALAATPLSDDLLADQCRPDVERVREIFDVYAEAWTKQNAALLDKIFTKHATYREAAYEPPLMGLSEIKQYWDAKVVQGQADITFKLLDAYVDGSTAVVEWEAAFMDRVAGDRKQLKEVAILEIEGGKIRSFREYWASKKTERSSEPA